MVSILISSPMSSNSSPASTIVTADEFCIVISNLLIFSSILKVDSKLRILAWRGYLESQYEPIPTKLLLYGTVHLKFYLVIVFILLLLMSGLSGLFLLSWSWNDPFFPVIVSWIWFLRSFSKFPLFYCIRIFGLPTEDTWPGVSKLPDFNAKKFPKWKPKNLKKVVSYKGSQIISDEGIDLLSKMLQLDPRKRISARRALEHPWFSEKSPNAINSTSSVLQPRNTSTSTTQMEVSPDLWDNKIR